MVSCGISTPFGVLFPSKGEVAHALLTRPPLKHQVASYPMSPLDLHVLGTPPAFVLSQDQTLAFNPLSSHQFPDSSLLIRNYCLSFALLFLYRFQGSVLAALASQLRYNNIDRLFCQHLFANFLKFF